MAGNAENGTGRYWNHWRLAGWGAGVLILIVPLVAMQLTGEVNWSVFDFIFAGTLVAVTGIIFELVVKLTGSMAYRAGTAAALGTAVLLIWVSGAVGIIGSEDNPANLMYFGVLAILAFGAVVARFRPGGMARVLIAAAIAQALIAAIAIIGGLGRPASPPLELLGINGFFVILWLGGAWLFWKAGEEARAGANGSHPAADGS